MNYVSILGTDEQAVLNQIFHYVVSSNSDGPPAAIKLETSNTQVNSFEIVHKNYETLVDLINGPNLPLGEFSNQVKLASVPFITTLYTLYFSLSRTVEICSALLIEITYSEELPPATIAIFFFMLL